MKKLLAALAFCSMSSMTLAQDFGKMLISGSASFSTNKTENVVTYGEMRSTRFAISPSVGFFVNPKIAVGAYGSYSLNSAPFTLGQSSSGEYPIIENKISAYSFGSFARAYQPIGTKVAFFGQLSAFYTRSKTEYDEGELSSSLHFHETSSKGGGVTLSPGFVFFPSNSIGLECLLGSIAYSRMTSQIEKPVSSTVNNAFDVNIGLRGLSLGISLYLGRTTAE